MGKCIVCLFSVIILITGCVPLTTHYSAPDLPKSASFWHPQRLREIWTAYLNDTITKVEVVHQKYEIDTTRFLQHANDNIKIIPYQEQREVIIR